MSDFRFTAFDNLKTPESWIEKAVNIPKTNKKPIPMFLRPTVIGSAAVVCLVTAVVLTLRLTFGFGKPPVNPGQAVAPHSLAVSPLFRRMIIRPLIRAKPIPRQLRPCREKQSQAVIIRRMKRCRVRKNRRLKPFLPKRPQRPKPLSRRPKLHSRRPKPLSLPRRPSPKA